MRQYIRHPSRIPIDLQAVADPSLRRVRMRDVSAGGLCFEAPACLAPGTQVHLAIPVQRPPFEADAVVAWCHPTDDHFRVGVRLDSRTSAFALRMVEQICHIEQYRHEVREREGRDLDSEQAAAEWIGRYADKFPKAW